MGYPTKVQLISRKQGADQYYINFPTAVAEAMEFQKGEIIEFDIEPKLIEQFGMEASEAIKARMREGHSFALVTTAEARPYARMMIERMFPALPVLSQLEIARGFEVRSIGSISQ